MYVDILHGGVKAFYIHLFMLVDPAEYICDCTEIFLISKIYMFVYMILTFAHY